jgi:hypothetical protein
MGGLANRASPTKVARAKSNQQNPICLWRLYIEVYERVEEDQRGVRVVLQP